jgi:hypothetical protein
MMHGGCVSPACVCGWERVGGEAGEMIGGRVGGWVRGVGDGGGGGIRV